MEIIFLFCLYYLSQRPDFAETLKPVLGGLKSSEDMLKFMNDLSRFQELFSLFSTPKDGNPHAAQSPTTSENRERTPSQSPPQKDNDAENQEKNPSEATKGITDEFIADVLRNYFKNR